MASKAGATEGPEEVQTALRVGRLRLIWILANGKAPSVFPISEKFLLTVEGLRDARTTLAACFNVVRLSHMRWDLQPRPLQIPPAGSHNYRIAHKPGLPADRNNYGLDETGHAVRSLAG